MSLVGRRVLHREVTGWWVFVVILAAGLMGGFVLVVGLTLAYERWTDLAPPPEIVCTEWTRAETDAELDLTYDLFVQACSCKPSDHPGCEQAHRDHQLEQLSRTESESARETAWTT